MSNKKEGYVYTRFGNPTVRNLERKMADFEGAEDAAAFSSGMAAISSTSLTLVSSGDHIVSFEINGDFEATMKSAENLKPYAMAPTSGGTETLVTQPVTSSHYTVNGEDRKRIGITDQLVRVSLGIEEPENIIADLEQAFAGI